MNRYLVTALFVLTSVACSGEGRQNMTIDDVGQTEDLAADILADFQSSDVVTPDGSLPDLPPDVCLPDCEGKECGDDGCGGTCGNCPQVAPICGDDGKCQIECIPDCEEAGKECGDDGCGGSCGNCPQVAPYCVQFKCAVDCLPDCSGLDCGDDGCGGSCGECDGNSVCDDGACVCQPDCGDAECGNDGCGGSCGTCPAEAPTCVEGVCLDACVPDCGELECGDDGCEGSCGSCPDGSLCLAGLCLNTCEMACDGKACGTDGCGGWCGSCPAGKICTDNGQCVQNCTPDCSGVACGPDGCGGSCGICALIEGAFCYQGQCVTECVPECGNKVCGDDGCGGSCGACDEPFLCTLAGTCGSYCSQCTYHDSCFDLDFGTGSIGDWAVNAAQLVTKLGQTKAPSGGYMLKLTTGEGLTEFGSEATFQDCLPAGDYMMLVKWRLYSEEFKEWCGSQYQDSMNIKLTVGDVSEVIGSYTIDHLCEPQACLGCGSEFAGLMQSDVTFDQGDVWNTPWVDDWFPLTLVGDQAHLTLTVSLEDAGDGIYDTVVLVDRVRFVPCANACDFMECGDNPCGESCGECAGDSVCLDGFCCTPDCTGIECGDDGCGGSCGDCCEPTCDGTPCLPDGCGGTCPGLPGIECCGADADCDDGDICTFDVCESNVCEYSPNGSPLCCQPFTWEEDFEDGQASGFSLNSSGGGGFPGMDPLWSVTDTCGSHSAPYALYFGMAGGLLGQCLYSIGFPGMGGFSGTATTPTIQIPAQGATLVFWYVADILADPGDKLSLSVITNSSTVIWDKGDVPALGPNWQKATLSLNAFAGHNIQLRYSFETAGTVQAPGKGVLIDDMSITGYCGP